MSRCLQESCIYWTGDGCACQMLDIEPQKCPCSMCEENP